MHSSMSLAQRSPVQPVAQEQVNVLNMSCTQEERSRGIYAWQQWREGSQEGWICTYCTSGSILAEMVLTFVCLHCTGWRVPAINTEALEVAQLVLYMYTYYGKNQFLHMLSESGADKPPDTFINDA